MLEGLRETAQGSVGRDISTAQWVKSMLGNLFVTALTAGLFYAGHHLLVVRLGYSVPAVLLGTTSVVTAITAALYVYYVYVVGAGNVLASKPKRS
jgi:hypothetical protein